LPEKKMKIFASLLKNEENWLFGKKCVFGKIKEFYEFVGKMERI
jgi:hypothetical protein